MESVTDTPLHYRRPLDSRISRRDDAMVDSEVEIMTILSACLCQDQHNISIHPRRDNVHQVMNVDKINVHELLFIKTVHGKSKILMNTCSVDELMLFVI